MTFEQAAISFGWGELVNFAKHLPDNSATLRAKHPDLCRYATGLQHSAILADIADLTMAFMMLFAKAHGAKLKNPNPYPRPWATAKENAQRIGADPIPISEFNEWYYGGD